MTDYIATARRQIAEEDAAAMAARVRDRADALRKADANRVPALPTDRAEATAQLAALRSRHAALLARKELAKRNPAFTISASEDQEILRLKSEIETIERHLATLGKLAA